MSSSRQASGPRGYVSTKDYRKHRNKFHIYFMHASPDTIEDLYLEVETIKQFVTAYHNGDKDVDGKDKPDTPSTIAHVAVLNVTHVSDWSPGEAAHLTVMIGDQTMWNEGKFRKTIHIYPKDGVKGTYAGWYKKESTMNKLNDTMKGFLTDAMANNLMNGGSSSTTATDTAGTMGEGGTGHHHHHSGGGGGASSKTTDDQHHAGGGGGASSQEKIAGHLSDNATPFFVTSNSKQTFHVYDEGGAKKAITFNSSKTHAVGYFPDQQTPFYCSSKHGLWRWVGQEKKPFTFKK